MRRPGRRLRRITAVLTLGALGLFAAASPVLADDTTPPEGTFRINGGDAYTTDPHLDLDVTATDDVGVTTVRIRHNGGDWTTFPYSPHIAWDAGNVPDGTYQLEVDWRDAAGNGAGAFDSIDIDRTAPTLITFSETTPTIGAENTATFVLETGGEVGSGTKVRFSSNGGTTWGAPQALDDPMVVWDPFDTDHGGSTKLGPRTVSAQVRDAAGNWSNVRSTSITAHANVSIHVSANPTTGQSITLTPHWDHTVSFPSGTYCRWDFAWGDDQSLYESQEDESYGKVSIGGLATAGYCDDWRFTLPWTSVRQYLIAYTVTDDDILADATLGGSPSAPNLSVAVGSTSRDITSSNLPMIYVLPEDWELTVGVPTTYHAHGVGGATIKSTDEWHVQVTNHQDFYPGSNDLTFTPTQPGHVTVCLYRPSLHGPLLGACYDPPVHRGSGSPGSTGAPGPGATAAATDPPASGALPSEQPMAGPPTAGPDASQVAVVVPGPSGTNEPQPASPGEPASATTAVSAGLLALLGAAAIALGAGSVAWRRGWRPKLPRRAGG